jgi:hypothetical protein
LHHPSQPLPTTHPVSFFRWSEEDTRLPEFVRDTRVDSGAGPGEYRIVSNALRLYRRTHGRSAPQPTSSAGALARLLDQVKNNVVFDLKSCTASVWLVSSDERVKNIVATAELIVVQRLSVDGQAA